MAEPGPQVCDLSGSRDGGRSCILPATERDVDLPVARAASFPWLREPGKAGGEAQDPGFGGTTAHGSVPGVRGGAPGL